MKKTASVLLVVVGILLGSHLMDEMREVRCTDMLEDHIADTRINYPWLLDRPWIAAHLGIDEAELPSTWVGY